MLFEIYLLFVFLSALSCHYMLKMGEVKYTRTKLITVVCVSVIPLLHVVVTVVGGYFWLVFAYLDVDGTHRKDFVAHMQKTNTD